MSFPDRRFKDVGRRDEFAGGGVGVFLKRMEGDRCEMGRVNSVVL